jgi:hypothetical protein
VAATPTPPSGERKRHARADSFVTEHITTLLALSLGLFMLVKCYAAGRYSLTTASALLTTSPVNVLLGTITRYAYELVTLVGLGAICLLIAQVRRDGWTMVSTGLALVVLLFIPLSPLKNLWRTTALLVLVLLVAKVAHEVRSARHRKKNRSEVKAPSLRLLIGSYFAAAVLYTVAVTLPDLWVPVEVLTLKGSPKTQVLVGFVLKSESGWTSVIRSGDRGISRIPSDDIAARTLCHLPGQQPWGRRPLYYRFIRKPYDSPNRNCKHVVEDIPTPHLVHGSTTGQ